MFDGGRDELIAHLKEENRRLTEENTLLMNRLMAVLEPSAYVRTQPRPQREEHVNVGEPGARRLSPSIRRHVPIMIPDHGRTREQVEASFKVE